MYRLRLGGGARHKRRASGCDAAWQQQRQLLALDVEPSAFTSHHNDDSCGGCHMELELKLELELDQRRLLCGINRTVAGGACQVVLEQKLEPELMVEQLLRRIK